MISLADCVIKLLYVMRVCEFIGIEIKEAVERLFDVRVATVRTMVVRGKVKRFGRHYGKRPNWKKAYVTVDGDEVLNVYGGA